jgi:hypothetical protein
MKMHSDVRFRRPGTGRPEKPTGDRSGTMARLEAESAL